MKNFLKCAATFDPAPLLAAIERDPALWSLDTFWKDCPVPVFGEVDTIYLRFPKQEIFTGGDGDILECHDQPALALLPEFRPAIFGLMAMVRGERLGRVLINCLSSGAAVLPHSDTGGSESYYDRFHVVLCTNALVDFRADAEHASMQAGEVWWFDYTKEHEVVNGGDCARIHLIVDIKIRRSNAAS